MNMQKVMMKPFNRPITERPCTPENIAIPHKIMTMTKKVKKNNVYWLFLKFLQ